MCAAGWRPCSRAAAKSAADANGVARPSGARYWANAASGAPPPSPASPRSVARPPRRRPAACSARTTSRSVSGLPGHARVEMRPSAGGMPASRAAAALRAISSRQRWRTRGYSSACRRSPCARTRRATPAARARCGRRRARRPPSLRNGASFRMQSRARSRQSSSSRPGIAGRRANVVDHLALFVAAKPRLASAVGGGGVHRRVPNPAAVAHALAEPQRSHMPPSGCSASTASLATSLAVSHLPLCWRHDGCARRGILRRSGGTFGRRQRRPRLFGADFFATCACGSRRTCRPTRRPSGRSSRTRRRACSRGCREPRPSRRQPRPAGARPSTSARWTDPFGRMGRPGRVACRVRRRPPTSPADLEAAGMRRGAPRRVDRLLLPPSVGRHRVREQLRELQRFQPAA